MAQFFNQEPVEHPVQKAQEDTQKAVQEQTAPAPVRHYRTYIFQAYVLIAIALFAGLSVLANTHAIFPIDVVVTHSIQAIRLPGFPQLMQLVSWFGFSPQSPILTGLLIVLLWVLGLRWESIAAMFAAGGAAVIDALVKAVIQRPRPGADVVTVFQLLNSYSFPSGHVMYYTAFFGFMLFLTYSLLKHSWPRTVLLVILSLLLILVGPSRIYEGEHWFSDVIGAYLLGTLVLAAVILVYRWGKDRFWVKQPVAQR